MKTNTFLAETGFKSWFVSSLEIKSGLKSASKVQQWKEHGQERHLCAGIKTANLFCIELNVFVQLIVQKCNKIIQLHTLNYMLSGTYIHLHEPVCWICCFTVKWSYRAKLQFSEGSSETAVLFRFHPTTAWYICRCIKTVWRQCIAHCLLAMCCVLDTATSIMVLPGCFLSLMICML